tara:strand:- start:1228 stop:1938 length:711 start_codon:yes stop_codon:yes gene_type:complete
MNLGIIIARKNSKRLKNKNLSKIGKYNLIQISMIQALKVKRFKKIIINSDIPEIKNYFKFLNKRDLSKIIFMKRPKHLSMDKSKSVDVVIDSINRLKNHKFLTITLMLPSCPLRKASDINKGLSKINKKMDTVISVCKTKFPPQFTFFLKNKFYLKPNFKNCPLIKNERRTQDFSNNFRPNGGFYISYIDKLKKSRNFFKGKIIGVEMPVSRSIDIDTYEDLQFARIQNNKNLLNK